MTITLHWWALPLALFIAGPMLARLDKSTGYMGGLAGALTCLACWIAAAFTLIGHFL